MRKFVKAAGLGVLLGLSMAAVAGDNSSADTRAYLNFNFGGDRALTRDWHTGLQLSSVIATDARIGEFVNAGSMKLDFSNRGNALMINGVPLVSKSYQLQQAEGEAAAAAEEGGFFSGIGDFFSNLFGGGEEEAVAEGEEAAAAEEAAAEEVAGEPGMFDGYTTGDWALLGVGVLGAGYLIAEAASSDDSKAGGGGGTPPPAGPNCTNPITLILDPDCPLPGFTGKNPGGVHASNGTYQQWLDEGTGQMGDLVAQ